MPRTVPATDPPPALLRRPARELVRPGTTLDGKYEVDREIGRAGMGAVFVATHRTLGRKVAIKVLHTAGLALDGSRELFRREARILARLDHPNVVRIYDLGELSADAQYIVMELLEGEDLQTLIRRRGALPRDRVCAMGAQAARGLAAAHAAGIIHLDVKPSNLFLARGGDGIDVVKVIDFGVAELLGREDDLRAGRSGTPPYMAPERLARSGVDARCDLWSLAVVIVEALTGRGLFRGPTSEAIETTIMAFDPTCLVGLVPDLPPALEAALIRAFARDPADRPADMQTFARALEAFAGPLLSEAPGASAGPVRAPSSHFLPIEPGALIGREPDLGAIEQAFDEGARCLTLLGMGGTGKTRLALRYGWVSLARWPGGAWFVDLSEATTQEGIVIALAGALGVPLGGRDPVSQLGRVLASLGRSLVIFDNFEQVAAEAADTLGRWLRLAPELRALVTSREVLSIDGGRTQGVEPLALADAVALFRQRSSEGRSSHEDPANAETLEVLVTLLDRLPLAIELAASRARLLTPRVILERLSDRFQLLTTSARRHRRQATLRGALDWSWELMSPHEQRALAQLSVFEGGFSLHAAEQVLDLEEIWPLDALQALVDKSLLRRTDEDRFGLLVTVAAYAAEKLNALGLRESAERCHGEFYAQLGTPEALAALDAHGGLAKRHLTEREVENLAAASRRAVARGDALVAGRTALAAWSSIELRGPFSRGVALLEAALRIQGTPERSGALSLALGAARRHAGDWSASLHDLQAAHDIFEAAGAGAGCAAALLELGRTNVEIGRVDAADECFEASIALARAHTLQNVEAIALGSRAFRELLRGRLAPARADLETSIALLHRVGNRRREAFSRSGLATITAMEGDLESARSLWIEAGAVMREFGDLRGETTVELDLGQLERERGHYDEAARRIREALEGFRRLGEPRGEAVSHAELGAVAFAVGDVALAKAHCAAAEELLRNIGERYHLALLLATRARGCATADPALALADLAACETLAVELSLGPDSEPGRRLEEARQALGRPTPAPASP